MPNLFVCRKLCVVLIILASFVGRVQADAPTVEQVDQALQIAELAARNEMTRLSLDAVQRALSYGMPTVSRAAAQSQIIHSGARVNTSLPLPKTDVEIAKEHIPQTIFRLSAYWKKNANPEAVFSVMRSIVLLSRRPGELELYNQTVTVNPLQPDRIPQVRSVANELVFWADKAGKTEELYDAIKQGYSEDSSEANLLILLCAIAMQNDEVLKNHITSIEASLNQATRRETAEALALLGISVQQSRRNPQAAADLLKIAGLALSRTEMAIPRDQRATSLTRAVLLAAARGQFAVGDSSQAVALLKAYLGASTEDNSSTEVRSQRDSRLEVVARELYSRQLKDEARTLLGDANADAFERRYAVRTDGAADVTQMKKPDLPYATLRLPLTISRDQIASTQDVADRIWVCSLDTVENTSKILFVLADCQNAGSPRVSPDGTEVVFDATFPQEAMTSDRKLYVASLDGASVRSLGRGTMPSWSPEGKRIACSKYSPEMGVWILRADGTDSQLLDRTGWAGQWSPDGQMIAYAKQSSQYSEVAVFDLVEDRYFRFTPGSRQASRQTLWNVSWSPDSSRIAYMSDQGIGIADVSRRRHVGDIFTEDVPYGSEIDWHRSANRVVFAPKFSRLGSERLHYLNSKKPEAPVYVLGQMPDRRNSSASWMNDGTTLIYISKPLK